VVTRHRAWVLGTLTGYKIKNYMGEGKTVSYKPPYNIEANQFRGKGKDTVSGEDNIIVPGRCQWFGYGIRQFKVSPTGFISPDENVESNMLLNFRGHSRL
jgi:hypothetical protein